MRVGALNSIREFMTGQALMTILDVFFSVVFIAFMLYYSVTLTLIALVVIPLYVVQNIWAVPIIKRKIEAVWRTGAANNAFLVEAITGIQTVKALAIEPQFNHRWENLLGRYVRTTFENATFQLVINGGSGLIQQGRITGDSLVWRSYGHERRFYAGAADRVPDDCGAGADADDEDFDDVADGPAGRTGSGTHRGHPEYDDGAGALAIWRAARNGAGGDRFDRCFVPLPAGYAARPEKCESDDSCGGKNRYCRPVGFPARAH